jgi:uncharacterized membrane protein YeaQ/YmgE (transglycosylase-associated protein family)
MNMFLWAAAGAMLGWIGYAFLGFNEGRNKFVAVVIGALGGIVGGKLVAPAFTGAAIPADFSAIALVFAVIVSAAFLYAGNFVHDRWNV